jgi:hypothetical protein
MQVLGFKQMVAHFDFSPLTIHHSRNESIHGKDNTQGQH